ncbi:MAG: response regulator transcription factor [Campylobacterales bacterium]|nr:response regulator transcription factor [Campylobacterales bacterium]
MKLYLVSSMDSVLNHWNRALKKYHPIKLKTINELNQPNEGIVFVHDSALSDIELHHFLRSGLSHIMVLSMVPDFNKAQQVLNAGAMGYGNALMHESHLQSAYQAIEEGKVWLYPDFIAALISRLAESQPKAIDEHKELDKLSVREREVALLLAQGMTHNEVSEKLDITVRTIKAHCSAIYEKLAVKDRLGLSLLLHS